MKLGIEYKIESDQIIKTNDVFIYSQTEDSILNLIEDPEYTSVKEHLSDAHEHHRLGQKTACVNSCHNALESLIKIICEKKDIIIIRIKLVRI